MGDVDSFFIIYRAATQFSRIHLFLLLNSRMIAVISNQAVMMTTFSKDFTQHIFVLNRINIGFLDCPTKVWKFKLCTNLPDPPHPPFSKCIRWGYSFLFVYLMFVVVPEPKLNGTNLFVVALVIKPYFLLRFLTTLYNI